MKPRNIILAPCGNKATLFKEEWLKYEKEKEFEVCLLFYHEHIEHPERYKDVDYFYHLKGFKYHMLHQLLTVIRPEWLKAYDYFLLMDDDIQMDTRQINRLFALSKAFNSSISCASLTHDSFCSWPIFKQAENTFCRYVGQIEVMAPLFSAPALQLCLPSFIGNKSSWGMDSVWSKLLDYPKDKLVVFDLVTMRHIHPVGKGELYQKIGDPHKEWNDITARYGAKKENYKEYGRLQLVNQRSHRFFYYIYKLDEAFMKLRRRINDYDLPSRVRSQTRKLLGKSGSLPGS